MPTNDQSIRVANSKGVDQLLKLVGTIGKDATIKGFSAHSSIFIFAQGMLVCRNCGSLSASSVMDQPLPRCDSCGMTHAITVFIGTHQTDIELTENGKQ